MKRFIAFLATIFLVAPMAFAPMALAHGPSPEDRKLIVQIAGVGQTVAPDVSTPLAFDPATAVSADDWFAGLTAVGSPIVVPAGVTQIDIEIQVSWLPNASWARYGFFPQLNGTAFFGTVALGQTNVNFPGKPTNHAIVRTTLPVVAGDVISVPVSQNSGVSNDLNPVATYIRIIAR